MSDKRFEAVDHLLESAGIGALKENNNNDDVVHEEIQEDFELEEEYVPEAVDYEIFSEIDKLTEDGMRSTIRGIVLESNLENSEKLAHLERIENAHFREDHIAKFMNDVIHPVLEIGGVLSPNYMKQADAPVAVSLIVYEAARALELSRIEYKKTGNIKIHKRSSVSEDAGVKTLLSYLKEDFEEEVAIPSYLNIPRLSAVFEKWCVEDNDLKEFIVEDAITELVCHGFKNLVPSLYEITDMVLKSNKYYDAVNEAGVLQRLEDGKWPFTVEALSEKTSIFKTLKSILSEEGGEQKEKAAKRVSGWVKGKWTKAGNSNAVNKASAMVGSAKEKVLSNKKAAGAATVGTAAALTGAALLRRRNKKKKEQQQESGAAEILLLKAQKAGCLCSESVDGCNKYLSKYINKWS